MNKSTIINTLRTYDGNEKADYNLKKIGEKDEGTLYLVEGRSNDDDYFDCDFNVFVYGEDDDIFFCSKDWQSAPIGSIDDIASMNWIAVRVDGASSASIMLDGMPRVLPLI